jgi:hypothetical protein
MIQAERQRQIEAEGWTPDHDDEHDSSEMAMAAAAYCWAAQLAASMEVDDDEDLLRFIPDYWPWAESWWKPSADPIRSLVKAGALIAAEIDRLQRRSDPEGAP